MKNNIKETNKGVYSISNIWRAIRKLQQVSASPVVSSALTYDYAKVANILDITEEPTWTSVTTLTVPTTIGSVYEYKLAVQGTIRDLNDYASIRFKIDGGPWNTFIKEAKDVDDTFGVTYLFPRVATGIETTFVLEAAKEVGGARFDIQFADLIIQQVKQ